MLRYTVILLLACLGDASGCCYPDKWEAYGSYLFGVTDFHGKTIFFVTNCKTSFDATGQRVRIDGITTTGNTTRKITLLDLNLQNVRFVIGNGMCTVSELEPWNERIMKCIPDTAVIVRKYRLAENPETEVADYSWSIGTTQIVRTVTTDGCVPVAKKQMGGDLSETFVMTRVFHGYTPGIEDPAVFDIPDICNGGNVVEIKGRIRKRRSVLF